MVEGEKTERMQPLTTGWKVAIAIALGMAIGSPFERGLSLSQSQRQIDSLQTKVNLLQGNVNLLQTKVNLLEANMAIMRGKTPAPSKDK